MNIITDAQLSPVNLESRRSIRLNSGDQVRVHQKIQEKNKTRIQIFEGVVLSCKHGQEPGATFTVRRVGTDGIAVEKIFPLFSPMIDKIEITARRRTRKSKLFFLRGMIQRKVREKLRKTKFVNESTVSESKEKKEKVELESKVVEDAQLKEEKKEEVKEEQENKDTAPSQAKEEEQKEDTENK